MPASPVPNVFTNNLSTLDATTTNANNAALYAGITHVDNTQVGAAGFFASQLIPTTGPQAIFGGTLAYAFANGLGVTGGVTATTFANAGGQFACDASGNVSSASLNVTGSISAGTTLAAVGQVSSTTNSVVAAVVVGANGYTAPSAATRIVMGISTGVPVIVCQIASVTMQFQNNAGGTFMPLTGGLYTNASDSFWKRNIADMQHGLRTIKALRPRTFTWKDSGKHDVGLVANEVVSVIPEVVSVIDEAQHLGINYSGLVSVLVKAVQELSERIVMLERAQA